VHVTNLAAGSGNQPYAAVLLGHGDIVAECHFCPTSPQTLLSVSWDGTLRMWDAYKDSKDAPPLVLDLKPMYAGMNGGVQGGGGGRGGAGHAQAGGAGGRGGGAGGRGGGVGGGGGGAIGEIGVVVETAAQQAQAAAAAAAAARAAQAAAAQAVAAGLAPEVGLCKLNPVGPIA
jgi:hypothetical protein